MRPQGFISATFSFTKRAASKIGQLRHDLELSESKKFAAVGFAWGHATFDDGSKCERPVIGFYDESQMDTDARASIQTIDGIDLIVFSTPDQAKNFNEKTIDYSDERGFFVL